MLYGTLFQARGPLCLKDCLVIFNLQNKGYNLDWLLIHLVKLSLTRYFQKTDQSMVVTCLLYIYT